MTSTKENTLVTTECVYFSNHKGNIFRNSFKKTVHNSHDNFCNPSNREQNTERLNDFTKSCATSKVKKIVTTFHKYLNTTNVRQGIVSECIMPFSNQWNGGKGSLLA